MIPYGKQDISQTDIDAVVEVLQSDWLTQGPMVPQFEQAVANKVGAQYAVAVNSATSALHIACLALGLESGDWLWTSPISFVASANCGLYCGAQVDFVDIDSKTYNLNVEALATKLEQAEKEGKLPKVLIPVHFSGQACDMAEIRLLSQKYGFSIIEDASHAIGGAYQNKPIGCNAYSDITIFSFHPVKILTTGEGGMALTNHDDLFLRMQAFRSHGITRDIGKMHGPSHGAWYYEQLDLGFNYRMTDIQAALGLSQLERLEQFVVKRRQLAGVYDEALSNLPLIRPYQSPDTCSAFHLYVVQVDASNSPASRNDLFAYLRQAGIGVNVHYIPIYRQPYYQQMNHYQTQHFIEAERYYANAITLPLHFGLQNEAQQMVVESLQKILQA